MWTHIGIATLFIIFNVAGVSCRPEHSQEEAKEPCIAVGGPGKGMACVFPFSYLGVAYNECQYYLGTPVCATMVDEHGSATDYGFCGPSCPINNKRDSIGDLPPRNDGRCGLQFGGAICSVDTSYGPCCSPLGYCGSTDYHCKCKDCKDFGINEDNVSGKYRLTLYHTEPQLV